MGLKRCTSYEVLTTKFSKLTEFFPVVNQFTRYRSQQSMDDDIWEIYTILTAAEPYHFDKCFPCGALRFSISFWFASKKGSPLAA